MTASPASRNSGQWMSAHDRTLLFTWSRSQTLAARVVLRSRIILMLADGDSVKTVATALGIVPATVRLWGRRFRESGPSVVLRDAPGRGRKPALDLVARRALRQGSGVEDAVTVRERARELGVSASTVSRWRRRTE